MLNSTHPQLRISLHGLFHQKSESAGQKAGENTKNPQVDFRGRTEKVSGSGHKNLGRMLFGFLDQHMN